MGNIEMENFSNLAFSDTNVSELSDAQNADLSDEDEVSISKGFFIAIVFVTLFCAVGNAIVCYGMRMSYQSQVVNQRKRIEALLKKIKQTTEENARMKQVKT